MLRGGGLGGLVNSGPAPKASRTRWIDPHPDACPLEVRRHTARPEPARGPLQGLQLVDGGSTLRRRLDGSPRRGGPARGEDPQVSSMSWKI